MSDAPEKPSLKRFLPLLGLPAVLGPLVIFIFILRTESAHDEATCPYASVSERALQDGSRIVEERRTCIEGVEERRYVLFRGDHKQVLGRRRFDEAAFDEGYAWDAGVSDAGEVQMHVQNPGHDPMDFREGRADEK